MSLDGGLLDVEEFFPALASLASSSATCCSNRLMISTSSAFDSAGASFPGADEVMIYHLLIGQ